MTLDPILCTPLRQIGAPAGAVFHGLKQTDPGFAGFGEAYFSQVGAGAIKGWKRHNRMTLNFVVPTGLIQVSATGGDGEAVSHYLLGPVPQERYARLTVPPGWWIAFGGLAKANMLLNIASISHDPAEADNAPLNQFPWEWCRQ